MSQICYVITNAAYPDWVKIGFTSKSEMTSRLRVYQTGSPFRDYEVYHEVLFDDAKLAEKEVHKRLKQMGATSKNEWFKISKRLASNMIDAVFDDIDNGLL
ncbi:hypothetical protein XaC1_337 [Xanthomonas phage XaC1]|nr:hypothetical protein XaC1_337 [Xanthomonas phage XaC1]